eukprot:g58649.t1
MAISLIDGHQMEGSPCSVDGCSGVYRLGKKHTLTLSAGSLAHTLICRVCGNEQPLTETYKDPKSRRFIHKGTPGLDGYMGRSGVAVDSHELGERTHRQRLAAFVLFSSKMPDRLRLTILNSTRRRSFCLQVMHHGLLATQLVRSGIQSHNESLVTGLSSVTCPAQA